jgi:hypothetical protein
MRVRSPGVLWGEGLGKGGVRKAWREAKALKVPGKVISFFLRQMRHRL